MEGGKGRREERERGEVLSFRSWSPKRDGETVLAWIPRLIPYMVCFCSAGQRS